MNSPWTVMIVAGFLIATPLRVARAESHRKPSNVNPTKEQMAELHLIQETETKDLEPLMAREKELLIIRNALVQAKIKNLPGKKTKAKARAVLKDPEVVAANKDITAVRTTIKEHRANFEARKKDIFVKH